MPVDLNDPEVKAAIDAAVDNAVGEALARAEEDKAGLVAKKNQLLAELKKAKQGITEIDPAEHQKLQDTVEELQAQLKDASKALKATQTDMTKQVETLTKQLQTESGFTQRLLVDNGLTEALVKSGVDKAFLPAVKAMLSSQVQIVTEGDERRAMVGNVGLHDYVSTWAQGEEGKAFVREPGNSGNGATGNTKTGGTGVKTIARGDTAAFEANIEAIASGQVQIVD